jgi:hypothetical protein
MKYLILVVLLAQPLLAITSAKKVRGIADKIHKEAVKNQLPNLLNEIEADINQQSRQGFYRIYISIDEYNSSVISKVVDILNEGGYHVSSDRGAHLVKYLFIEW